MSQPDPLKQYWHVVPDDEVGGWAVTNYNTDATSKLNPRMGHWVVAHPLSKEIAEEIVKAHNAELDRKSADVAVKTHDALEVRVDFRDQYLIASHRVPVGSNPSVYAVALYDLAMVAARKIKYEFHK